MSNPSQAVSIPGIYRDVMRHLPKTIEDLYTRRLDEVARIIKIREELNMGRRMVSWTADYKWEATPWDWVLKELKYLGNDMMGRKKWKKVAAYKLAKAAQIALPKIKAEWKTKEANARFIALKTSVMIKKAFYEEYANLKKAKEGELRADLDSKKNIKQKHLKDLMKWIIVNHEFQYQIPEESYYSLCKLLNPTIEIKAKDVVQSKVAEVKPYENDFFLMGFCDNDFNAPSLSIYDSFDYNEDAPRLMLIDDPYSEQSSTPLPPPLADQEMDTDLTNLMTIPPCNYDEIINHPLNLIDKTEEEVIEANLSGKVKKAQKPSEKKVEGENVLENLNEIFYGDTDKRKACRQIIDEGLVFFNTTEALEHKLNGHEDKELMDYLNHLPECTDPLYHEINQQ